MTDYYLVGNAMVFDLNNYKASLEEMKILSTEIAEKRLVINCILAKEYTELTRIEVRCRQDEVKELVEKLSASLVEFRKQVINDRKLTTSRIECWRKEGRARQEKWRSATPIRKLEDHL
jgi:hypothetical protein